MVVEEVADEEGEGDVVLIDLQHFPRTPAPWESLGSEFDVEDELVIESRPKVNKGKPTHYKMIFLLNNLDSTWVLIDQQVCFHSTMKHENDVRL